MISRNSRCSVSPPNSTSGVRSGRRDSGDVVEKSVVDNGSKAEAVNVEVLVCEEDNTIAGGEEALEADIEQEVELVARLPTPWQST